MIETLGCVVKFRFILILLFSFLVTPLYAANFDCNKATTETEKDICSSDQLLFSPNNKYVLTNFGQQCSAILYDLVKKEAVFRASGYSHKECFTFVGFSPDSTLWFYYDNNDLGVDVYSVEGKRLGYYKAAGDPYIDGVKISKDNKQLTIFLDEARPPVTIDISKDF